MRPPTRRHRPFARFFGHAAAILSFVAQLAVLGAGLAEGRSGVGYGAHFDRGGTSSHYVHDESLCAACQARTLHGVARIPQHPPVAAAPHPTIASAAPASLVGRDPDFSNFSRAPPAVI
jgi:hypothetical protein